MGGGPLLFMFCSLESMDYYCCFIRPTVVAYYDDDPFCALLLLVLLLLLLLQLLPSIFLSISKACLFHCCASQHTGNDEHCILCMHLIKLNLQTTTRILINL